MKRKTHKDPILTIKKSNGASNSQNGKSASSFNFNKSLIIESITPCIDLGKFPAKGTVGEVIVVEADIFKEGHDFIKANLKFREKSEKNWTEVSMQSLYNDLWTASFIPLLNSTYYYTIEAWLDPVATWLDEIEKKCLAMLNVKSEILEGVKLITEVISNASFNDKQILNHYILQLKMAEGIYDEALRIIKDIKFRNALLKYPIKRLVTTYEKELELIVDRKLANFSAWYELFPRSQGKSPLKSGTFKDCIKRLNDIKKMGFDVIYLPPIHPIGLTNRKGKNNSLTANEDDPGSPWAIGSKDGGHKSIHPELGTIDDFVEFVNAANDIGIEIALDFAIQCSPDHPYAKEHPEWFYHLPDGTIKYAENPPKKYQDIYPINFYSESPLNQKALWEELKSILVFWIEKGVKIFRVDNPHTKPLNFWNWVLCEIRKDYPEVIFLAEAFTRPKIMKYLAKAGFTQSYTYFTWRNNKHELIEYLEELTKSDMKSYFRGNFFANTPDILHEFLQSGGKAAFKIRLTLAATLSSIYGIYSGYELCENTPKEKGSEEYLNSEKYEIKVRNWNQEGNISDYISKINLIRKENPALHEYKNLEFYNSSNDNILCYGKRTADNSNIIVIVVNLDPFNPHEDTINLPLETFGISDWQKYQMKDLITSEKHYWKGSSGYIRLDPNYEVAHIFKLKK